MTVKDIVEKVKRLGRDEGKTHVVITGGEPTIHSLLEKLVVALKKEVNCFIQLETNGSAPRTDCLGLFDWITCSPKQIPSEAVLKHVDELKLLVSRDGLLVPEKVLPKLTQGKKVYIQALWRDKGAAQKCLELLKEHPEWRISFQGHKTLELP